MIRIKPIYTELSTPRTIASFTETNSPTSPFSSLKNSILRLAQDLSPRLGSNSSLVNSSSGMRKRKTTKLSILPFKEKPKGLLKTRRRIDDNSILSGRNQSQMDRKGYCKSNRAYIQFFTMLSFMYNKMKRKSFKVQVLIDQLILYFKATSQQVWIKQIAQILKLSKLLKSKLVQNQSGQFRYDTVKQCNGQLSKLFFNICYQIYLYKHNLQNLQILRSIHQDIEYYSRRLKMLNLAILSCMDAGRVCSEFLDFQNAELELSKAVKLAVFIGDKYSEEVAIDKIGMCEYYKGDIVSARYFHRSTDKLSSYDKWNIHKYYSNQNEIERILQEKTKERSHDEEVKQEFFRQNHHYQFNFDSMTKDAEYTQNNYDIFRNNLKQMIKVNSLRKKVPMIKNCLNKIESIGEKTYCGKEYHLPKASRYILKNIERSRSRQEVIMSHRSSNRNNLSSDTMRIDKHCKVIDQILNFFAAEQKNQIKQIAEVRQSYLSDDDL